MEKTQNLFILNIMIKKNPHTSLKDLIQSVTRYMTICNDKMFTFKMVLITLSINRTTFYLKQCKKAMLVYLNVLCSNTRVGDFTNLL